MGLGLFDPTQICQIAAIAAEIETKELQNRLYQEKPWYNNKFEFLELTRTEMGVKDIQERFQKNIINILTSLTNVLERDESKNYCIQKIQEKFGDTLMRHKLQKEQMVLIHLIIDAEQTN